MTTPRDKFFEIFSVNEWSLYSFLNWRSKQSDFSSRRDLEYSAWCYFLRKIGSSNSNGGRMNTWLDYLKREFWALESERNDFWLEIQNKKKLPHHYHYLRMS